MCEACRHTVAYPTSYTAGNISSGSPSTIADREKNINVIALRAEGVDLHVLDVTFRRPSLSKVTLIVSRELEFPWRAAGH